MFGLQCYRSYMSKFYEIHVSVIQRNIFYVDFHFFKLRLKLIKKKLIMQY